jgi:exopolysaccharide biosynthesis polyprenyl glycosylphosphotransferase
MLKQHARALDLGARLFDLVALTVALPIAHGIYAASPYAKYGILPARYWLALVFVIVAWVGASSAFRVYDTFRTRTLLEELARIAKTLGLVGLLVVCVLFLAREREVSRLFVVLYATMSFTVLAASRGAVRVLARALRRRGLNVRKFAIVGTGKLAAQVARTFAENPQWGLELTGFVLPEDHDRAPRGGRVLGTLAHLEKILDDEVLDEIVFAVSRDELSTIDHAVLLCGEQGVSVRVCLDSLRVGDAKMSVFELSGIPMLVFTRTPSDVVSLALKRGLDLCVSVVLMVAFAPVFLAVALAVKLDSPGPIFFRQRRVGLYGREFRMLKFRSMYVDAEARLEALLGQNEMSGPVFKMRNDPRVTRVGRFIRRTSLDELPQFWNVLSGEMSLVGPRPPLPAEVRKYKRWHRRRLSMRPGITCIWQISGRNEIDFDQWMALDLEYIDQWSLWRDVEICRKTIPAVLAARGAQ